MLRYVDGDVKAFECLYRRHNDSLYRYLLRLTHNQQVAEDLFQEAWSKIIRSRSSYRATARFSTFLFSVAHNCFIDYLRRNKHQLAHDDTDPDTVADPGDAPEEQAERLFARRQLEKALHRLPHEQREVFLLCEEGRLTLEEIARVTGVNRETAKSRLRYAVSKLKASLATAGTDAR